VHDKVPAETAGDGSQSAAQVHTRLPQRRTMITGGQYHAATIRLPQAEHPTSAHTALLLSVQDRQKGDRAAGTHSPGGRVRDMPCP
jgi:hypothetical protein